MLYLSVLVLSLAVLHTKLSYRTKYGYPTEHGFSQGLFFPLHLFHLKFGFLVCMITLSLSYFKTIYIAYNSTKIMVTLYKHLTSLPFFFYRAWEADIKRYFGGKDYIGVFDTNVVKTDNVVDFLLLILTDANTRLVYFPTCHPWHTHETTSTMRNDQVLDSRS